MSTKKNSIKSLLIDCYRFQKLAQEAGGSDALMSSIFKQVSSIRAGINVFLSFVFDAEVVSQLKMFQNILTLAQQTNTLLNNSDLIAATNKAIAFLKDFKMSPSQSTTSQSKKNIDASNDLISQLSNLVNSLKTTSKKVREPKQNKENLTNLSVLNVQKNLNKLLVPMGKLVPIAEDGVLGDETRNALSVFKREFAVSNDASMNSLQAQLNAAVQLNNNA